MKKLRERFDRDQERLNEINVTLEKKLLGLSNIGFTPEVMTLIKEKNTLEIRQYYRRRVIDAPPKPAKVKVPYRPYSYSQTKKEDQRETMTGKTHSEETIAKIKKTRKGRPEPRVIKTPIGEFESIGLAAKALSITPAAIHHKLKAGQDGWSYVDRISTAKTGVQMGQKNYCIPVIGPDGTHYESIKDANIISGVTMHMIRKSLKLNTGWTYDNRP